MVDVNRQQVMGAVEMSEARFREAAVQTGNPAPPIQVVRVAEGGWAILGPFGYYQDADKTRVFEDLARVHEIIKHWGAKKFLQEGEPKEFF